MATVTRSGVKYIKVSKTDALGNNYDNSWKLNSSIKLNYSVEGLKEYAVNTITEYPTYWLLGLNYVDTTSSIQGAKNYTLSASLEADSVPIAAGTTLKPVSFAPITDSSGYYNTTTDEYVLGVATNIPIQVTASLYVENTGGAAAGVTASMTVNGGLEGQERRDISAGDVYTFTLKLTSQTYKYGDTISVEVSNKAGGPSVRLQKSGGAGKETYLFVTQSVAPASNTPTILNPFFTEPFVGTDCDVTYGWVDQVPYSQYYMDIDYADSATIPVNQAQLISGTATPALVKDYYYGMRRHTLPRYEGSRASSLKYNEYTGPIDDNINIGTPYGNYPLEGYQGDTAFGKTAAIDQYQSYAARFQYIAGYGPEMYNALLVYVTDIVDELGNVQQPKLDNPSYYNLTNAFEQGQLATVKLLDAQGKTQFAGLNSTFNIIRAGKRLETPLYTYTGSQTYTTNPTPLAGISFEGDANTPRFTTVQYSSSVQWVGGTTTTSSTAMDAATSTSRVNARFVSGDGYKLQSGDNNSLSPLQFKLNNLKVSIASGIPFGLSSGYYQSYDNWVNIKFVSSSNNPSTFGSAVGVTYSIIQDFGDKKVNAGTGTSSIDNITANSVQVREGFYYYFIIAASSFGDYVPVVNGYELEVNSVYPYNAGGANDVVYSTDLYFITSSTNRNILSASSILTSYYEKTQVYDSTAGFNPPIPFTIQEGDEIRFGGNELYSHIIYNVQQGPNITFNLLPPLSDEEYNIVTVNAASIRRYTDDPNTIIIAGNKAAGGTPGGIIKPKYTTKALEDAIDSNPLFTLQSGLSSS